MLEELQVFHDFEPKSAPINMAIDEALLGNSTAPILRFYHWQRPSISFGYFGRYAEIATEFEQRDIVRRWTGGGIVEHGTDLTYSIVIPRDHLFFQQSSPQIYAEVHNALCGALQSHGVDAVLANSATPKISETCFANPVRADVMVAGRKVAGAAHRRSRGGLLHQGSIQRNDLSDHFRERFARILCPQFRLFVVPKNLAEQAAQIAGEKYATNEWLTRW